ncbi:MAG: ATP-binding protein [Planctomycetes bacterium]|nr:ATP-binding protein [Planctomycetota bacterium]
MAPETISKPQVVSALAEKLGAPADRVGALFDAMLSAMRAALAEGADVSMLGLAKMRGAAAEGASALVIPSDDLAARMAAGAGGGASEAAGVQREALDFLRIKLLKGDRIFIADFFSVQIVEEKARIVRDELSGRRTIAPARNRISFGVADAVKAACGGAAVAFLPSKTLKEEIERLKTASILVVAPVKDFFVETIEYHFRRAGWDVQISTSLEESRRAVQGGKVYLVILDMAVEGAKRFVEDLKTTIATSLVPLILMHPKGVNIEQPEEFRVAGNEQVVQPFEVKQLLSVAEAELARASEEETIFRQEVVMQFPTEDTNIDRANELAARLFEKSGLDEEGQVALCAAFREAVGNAGQHGNRHRRDKMIEVLFLLDREKITCAVTDAGAGFDHRSYVVRGKNGNAVAAARERHAKGAMGGLGIMLMLKCCDGLEYNDVGNVVTLTKYLDPARREAAARN